MSKTKIIIALGVIGACTASNMALANGGIKPSPHNNEWWENLYIGIEGGMSMQNGLKALADYWERGENQYAFVPSPTGLALKDAEDTANVWGAKIGYNIDSHFSMDLAYRYHGNYDFRYAWDTIGYAGDYADSDSIKLSGFNSQTLTLDLNFFPQLNWGNFKPFISAGGGIAFNDSGDFSDESLLEAAEFPWSYSINSKHTNSFTWHVGVGTNYSFTDNFFVTAGYRFADLGKLETSTTGVDHLLNDETFSVTAWRCDNVYVNEFYLGVNYRF